MTESDRRRQVENALGALLRRDRLRPGGQAELSVEKFRDQDVALGRNASERIVTASLDGHELRAGQLGHDLSASVRLYAIVIAVYHQKRAFDLAIHRLADVESWPRRPCLHRPGEDRPRGVAGPGHTILDLLGRMRLAKYVADEVGGKVGIVREPIVVIVFAPILKLRALEVKMTHGHVGIVGSDDGRCAD